jgi:hypothetical protein
MLVGEGGRGGMAWKRHGKKGVKLFTGDEWCTLYIPKKDREEIEGI